MAFFSTSDSSLSIVLRLKDEATAQLKTVEGKLDQFQRKLEPAIGASQKFALALGGAGAALGAFGLSAVKAAANAEQTIIAFETMLGSAENAKKFYEDLVQFAARTPFELTGLETAAKQLLAYGFAQEEVLPNLRSLGDIASGVGMDKLPNLILAFGQVRAATKLTGMELRQFTEAGVPLLEELSNVMGQPVSAIQDMISEGEVGFPIVQQALQNLTGEGGRFNDLMEKQAQSLGGMWSNLQDAWEQFLREQGAQLIEWSKQFVGFLSDLVQNHLPVWIEKTREIVQWLDQNKVVLAAVVGIIAGALVPAVLAAVAAFVSMAVALAPFAIAGGALFMFIQGLREGNIVLTAVAAGIMTLFIPTLASLAATIFTTVIPAAISMAIAFAPFLIAGAVVAGLVAGIMLIIKHWDLLKAKATEIWNAIKNVIESVVESITDKIQKLISVINSVRSAISSIGSFVGKAASSVAGYVNPNANYFGPAAPRAGGGPVQAGQPYMVGERGPELFMPSSSGSIVPNNRMGGITVNINNPSVRNDGDIVAMKRMINEVFRDLAVNYKLTHS